MMSLETAMASAEILLIGLVFPEFAPTQQVSPQMNVSCNGFQCDLVDGPDYSTSKTSDKAVLSVVIPIVVITTTLLGVHASRRQRYRLETLPEKEDMHAYLQWKAELEAGQAKHEMKVEEKRFKMEGDNVRAEMLEAGDDRLVLRERHELSGEEISKELDIQSEG